MAWSASDFGETKKVTTKINTKTGWSKEDFEEPKPKSLPKKNDTWKVVKEPPITQPPVTQSQAIQSPVTQTPITQAKFVSDKPQYIPSMTNPPMNVPQIEDYAKKNNVQNPQDLKINPISNFLNEGLSKAKQIQPKVVYKIKDKNQDPRTGAIFNVALSKPLALQVTHEDATKYYFKTPTGYTTVDKDDVSDILPTFDNQARINQQGRATYDQDKEQYNSKDPLNTIARTMDRFGQSAGSIMVGQNLLNEKSDIGNPVVNTVTDIAGGLAGFISPSGALSPTGSLANTSINQTLPMTEKVLSKVLPKIGGNTLAKNLAARTIQGAAESIPLTIQQGIQDKPLDLLRRGVIDAGIGAAAQNIFEPLSNRLSDLPDYLKSKNIDKKMKNYTDKKSFLPGKSKQGEFYPKPLPPKPQIKPTTIKNNNLKFVDRQKQSAQDNLESAIIKVQDYFGTNELRTSEMARVKSELGIDLDKLVDDFAKVDGRKASDILKDMSERVRLKRVAGLGSDTSYNVIKTVTEQPPRIKPPEIPPKPLPKPPKINQLPKPRSPKIKNTPIEGTQQASRQTLENIVNNPKQYPPDMVARAQDKLKNLPDINNQPTRIVNETLPKPINTLPKPPNKLPPKMPTKINDDPLFRQSKFAQTVKNADTTPKDFKPKIRPPEYEVKNNQKTWDDAVSKVAKDYDGELASIRNKASFETADDTAKSQALLDKMLQDGRYDEAASFVDEVTLKLTQAGQTVQAASIWSRMTPSGMLKYAQKEWNKALTKLETPELKPIIAEVKKLQNQLDNIRLKKEALKKSNPTAFKEIAELEKRYQLNLQLFAEKTKKLPKKILQVLPNADDTSYVSKTMEQINKMKPGRARDIKLGELQKYIADKIPSTPGQKLSTLQTMGHLLNAKTAVRNILGNSGFMVMESLSDTLAVPIDRALSLVTKNKTKALTGSMFKGYFSGFKKGFTEGFEDALKGIDTSKMRSQWDLPTKTFNDPFFGTLEKVLNIELRATDRAFYQAAFNKSMAEQMAVKGFKSMDDILPDMLPEMTKTAHLDGLYKTFQDKNVISSAFSGIKNLLNGGKSFGFGDLILKYPKTPANLLARGLDYSPAGIVKAAFQMRKGLGNNQKNVVESLSRAAVGTGIMSLAAIMHKAGIIQGKKPKDKEAAELLRETGQYQYTFNVDAFKRFIDSGFNADNAKAQEGDTSISYDWLQPMALGIATGTSIRDNIDAKNKVNPLDVMGAVAISLESGVDSLAEQPLVQGVANLFKYGNVGESVSNTVMSAPSSFIPTFVNQIRQLKDNKSREVNSDKYYGVQKALNLIMNKIPVVSEKLPERVTTTGNTRELYQNGSNSWQNVLFNPAFVNKYKTTPGTKLILDLYQKTGSTKQFPREAPKTVTVGNLKYTLTANEKNEFQKELGQNVMNRLNQLDLDNYKDENAIKKIVDILDNEGDKILTRLKRKIKQQNEKK